MGRSSEAIDVVIELRGLDRILRLLPRPIGLIIFTIRSWQDSNNLIEQDRRSIKLRLGQLPGLKSFRRATIAVAGIKPMHRIRKGESKLARLHVHGKIAPEIWNAVLAEQTKPCFRC